MFKLAREASVAVGRRDASKVERDDLDRGDRANSSATASTSPAVREQCDIHGQRQGLPDAKRASENAGASVTRNQRRSVFPGPMGEGGGGEWCAGARTRGIMRRPVPFFPSKRRPDNRELNIQAAGEDGAAPTAEKTGLSTSRWIEFASSTAIHPREINYPPVGKRILRYHRRRDRARLARVPFLPAPSRRLDEESVSNFCRPFAAN